jgi:hypothetical protein
MSNEIRRPDEQTDIRKPEDQPQALSEEELQQQEAAELPDRENMSLINANAALPVNAAVALNALSDNSTAQAIAIQNAPIDQDI